MVRLGITGHQGLSPDIEEFIRIHLDTVVSSYKNIVGISSLAAGADQLFAQTVLAHDGMLEVIIPAKDYSATFTEESTAAQYVTLLAKATNQILLPYKFSCEEAFMAAGKEVVRRCDLLIAVWDGKPSRGKGGTADVVEFARGYGVPIIVIWPEGKSR